MNRFHVDAEWNWVLNNNLFNLSYVDGLTAMFYLEKLPLLCNAWLNTKAGIRTIASFWPKGMYGISISVCWHVCYLPRDANFNRHRKTLSFEEHICMHGISAIVVTAIRNAFLNWILRLINYNLTSSFNMLTYLFRYSLMSFNPLIRYCFDI